MIAQVFIPFALAMMMFSMGLGLNSAHFRQVIQHPIPGTITLVCQILILPLSALVICALFSLEPTIGLGLILIASCPGGITSNMFTRLAQGNTALSIGLTAVSSIIAVFTIPIVMQLASRFLGSDTLSAFSLSLPQTLLQISALTLIPLSFGMLIRRKRTAFAQRLERKAVLFAAMLFLFLIIITWIDQWQNIQQAAKEVGLAVSLMMVINMTIGFLLGRLCKLSRSDAATVIIEIGIQNSALAFMIASNILHNLALAIPSAIYSVIMVFAGLLVVITNSRSARPQLASQELS